MAEYIDRQAAINAVTAIEPLGDFAEIDGREVLDCLRELPTVEERKKGKWQNVYNYYFCTECSIYHPYRSAYCPSCGADMRGESDG